MGGWVGVREGGREGGREGRPDGLVPSLGALSEKRL